MCGIKVPRQAESRTEKVQLLHAVPALSWTCIPGQKAEISILGLQECCISKGYGTAAVQTMYAEDYLK